VATVIARFLPSDGGLIAGEEIAARRYCREHAEAAGTLLQEVSVTYDG
jgi:hypothetical protein